MQAFNRKLYTKIIEQTYKFIKRSYEQKKIETNGTEVSTILPPISMFTPNNYRQ